MGRNRKVNTVKKQYRFFKKNGFHPLIKIPDNFDVTEFSKKWRYSVSGKETPNLFPFGDPDYFGITKKMWDAAIPKITNNGPTGIPMIFGTGGDINTKEFIDLYSNACKDNIDFKCPTFEEVGKFPIMGKGIWDQNDEIPNWGVRPAQPSIDKLMYNASKNSEPSFSYFAENFMQIIDPNNKPIRVSEKTLKELKTYEENIASGMELKMIKSRRCGNRIVWVKKEK